MSVFKAFRHDVPASIVVFLIAIPLSLGIAAASGAPLLSGLIAAVVGGLVAGALGGAPLQVSGPAAGLTVIVAGTIAHYGFAATAAIVALAGGVQILLGASRLGRAALALSPAVVHGMLAGIGLVIALSQIHVVLGGAPQSEAWHNIRDLPAQISGIHGASVLLGLLTIAVLLVWPRLVRMPAQASPVRWWHRSASLLPAALVAVVVTTALAAALGADVARVRLPDDLELTLPQWPDAPIAEITVAVLTIALVASVESLLSAVAVDRMHDGPRADLNRELIAQGAANSVSGLLGGLPVTGVIVRSSTNVAAGARTRMSAMLHGVWVAVFVLLGAGLLETIPMAVLAAVLVVVGLRLISLAQIRTYVRHRELPTYLVTALGVVAFDLLTGVALGLAVALVLMLWRVARCEIRAVAVAPGEWTVSISGTLAFVGSGRLARVLNAIPPGETVAVELHLDYLDHGAFQIIEDWREAYGRSGGTVTVREMHGGWFARATSGRLGAGKTTPRRFGSWSQWQSVDRQRRDAMEVGIREFERSVAPLVRPHLAGLARDGQRPEQLFITCADSRMVPNLITTSGPGDLFCLRNIGNIVPPYGAGDSSVGAAIEYAVEVLHIRTITVCGHSGCGAVRALRDGGYRPDSELGRWLLLSGTVVDCPDDEARCERANVMQQLHNLRTYPVVRAAEESGALVLAGMYFDLAEARMHAVDPGQGVVPAVS
ncbi:bifunctional SulP family inorganic anion transporter/carbonic anhydrase [Actinoplanes sp. TBRC 11911]|uniref:bifunctional SulP family inorganic anion transporter/carbonic anhydrase n=1 Tax=Actinoplanes sp. TBRC 11911 TaxID=2729386 RepID=UPI00145CBFB1|nr:SulP family inorganic anion transporter [Actinoplanes sp. TBRC 11911]NMO53147.1 bifunctional SulP family inorganic anion transporter/carbonic anhydrase [Actinoplanes sp. TBRC 11911]